VAGVSHALAPDPWPVAAWCAGRGPWSACLVACYLVRALVRLVPGARPPILATWWPIRGPRTRPRAQKMRPVDGCAGFGPVLRSQWWPEQFSCSPETGPLCKKLDFGLQFFVEQIQFVP